MTPYELAFLSFAGSAERWWPQASGETAEYQRGYRETENLIDEFYAARVVDPLFEEPPEKLHVRIFGRNDALRADEQSKTNRDHEGDLS